MKNNRGVKYKTDLNIKAVAKFKLRTHLSKATIKNTSPI